MSNLSKSMHVGDLEPPFVAVLLQADGQPYNLSTATSVKFTFTRNGSTVINARAGTGSSAGLATMTWQSGDTSTAGEMRGIVVVEWSSGRPQTFPDGEVAAYYVVNVV